MRNIKMKSKKFELSFKKLKNKTKKTHDSNVASKKWEKKKRNDARQTKPKPELIFLFELKLKKKIIEIKPQVKSFLVRY